MPSSEKEENQNTPVVYSCFMLLQLFLYGKNVGNYDGPQTTNGMMDHKQHVGAKTPTAWWTTNGPRLKDPMSHCWEFHEESTWDGPVDIEITWNYCNSGKVLAQ